jgi:hypothetical protein
MDGREIVKLGVNFSSETRIIDAWERGGVTSVEQY